MQSGAFGSQIGRYFRLPAAPSLAVERGGSVKVAVTRLRSAKGMTTPTIIPARENAHSIHLHLKDSPDHALWLRGRHVFQGGYKAGTTSLVNLDDEPVARIGNAFDILQIYMPHASVDEVSLEHGGPPVRELTWPRGASDPTAARFAGLLLDALGAESTNTLFVDHIMLALRIHVAQTYGGVQAAQLRRTGGLAAWQERRAKDILEARCTESLSITELAAECGLSPSHFTRAFRRSTGMQPHRFLSGLRIERAKAYLLAGELPLAEIALACGFSDQSYFTRVFTRAVGISPGAWQRSCRA